MESYSFRNRAFYNAADVYKLEPGSFVGCSKNTRQILVKKNIPSEHFIFAVFIKSKSVWEPKEQKYNQAKLFLSTDWVHANLRAFKTVEEKDDFEIKEEVQKAPRLLYLPDNALFRDADGNTLNIEIRGERDISKIFFKLKDVSEKFSLPNIKNTLLTGNDWIKGEDYVLFSVSSPVDLINRTTNALFLTFSGIIRYLYTSRSRNAKQFQKWANLILFTHQFETIEKKRALASNLLGADVSSVKEAFKTLARTMPCIYLFSLGFVKDLRARLCIPPKYDDYHIVFKYGYTCDIARRTNEHQKGIGTIDGCRLALKFVVYIDPQFTSNAESDIRAFFKMAGLEFSNSISDELVIISKDNLQFVHKQYQTIGDAYAGHYSQLVHELKEARYQAEIQKLQHEKEILELRLAAAQ